MLAALFLLAFAPAPDTTQMEKLETAIPHGIMLLEKGKHAEFLQLFLEPEDLKAILKDKELEALEKEFSGEKAKLLLGALKEIKGQKPALADDGKKASFSLKTEVDGKKALRFVKHGKAWHLVSEN